MSQGNQNRNWNDKVKFGEGIRSYSSITITLEPGVALYAMLNNGVTTVIP